MTSYEYLNSYKLIPIFVIGLIFNFNIELGIRDLCTFSISNFILICVYYVCLIIILFQFIGRPTAILQDNSISVE